MCGLKLSRSCEHVCFEGARENGTRVVTRKKSRWRRKVKAGGGAKRMQKGRRREKAGWRRKEEAPEVASASPSQSPFS